MKRSGSARAAKLAGRLTEECRKACAAHPLSSPRQPSTAEFEVVDRNPASEAVFMILFGLAIIAFCIFCLYYVREEPDWLSYLAGISVFILAGLGLVTGGIASARSRSRLLVSGDKVSWEARKLFSRREFTEPLSSYLCVLPRSRLVGRPQHGTGMVFYAHLVHASDPGKNLSLLVRSLDEIGMLLDRGGERTRFEALARSLGLPLATETQDGVVIRNFDELDIPLAESLGAGSPLDRMVHGPSRPFPSRRYRITWTEGGWLAERGYLAYLVPFAFFAGACALIFILGPRLDLPGEAGEPLGAIGLVCGAFACFMLAFSLMRSRLELRRDLLEARYSIAGLVFMRQEIPLKEIEEVVDGRDEKANARSLLIASDKATITWAQRGSAEEITWFRDEILGAIGRDHEI